MTILRNAVLACFIIVLTVASVSAETVMDKKSNSSIGNQSGLSVGNGDTPFSLFDPSRLRMNHSYSMNFFSSGGHTQSIAMYMNQIDYQFAKPLRMQIGLAYIHQPQSLFGASTSSTINNKILPSFRLFWEPSRNFHVSVGYEQWAPGLMNSAYPNYYRSPYGRYGSFFE